MTEEINVSPEVEATEELSPAAAKKKVMLQARMARGRRQLELNKRPLLETKQIVAASLWDYTNDLADALEEGYEISSKSEYFPTTVGHLFMCTVLLFGEIPEKKVSEETKALMEEFPEQAGKAVDELPQEPKKTGRPKKAA